MTDNLIELQSYELVDEPCGLYAHFVATIADVVQTSPATRFDPPEFGSATCRGSLSIGDDDPFPKTEQQFVDLAQEVDDWQPIEDLY